MSDHRIHIGVSNHKTMPVCIQIDACPGVTWDLSLETAEWLRDELFAVCARLRVRRKREDSDG